MSKPTHDRQYLGVTVTHQNYREILNKEGRDGINFHSKHLRAYLKGHERFTHGFRKVPDSMVLYPIWHKVQQKLTTL